MTVNYLVRAGVKLAFLKQHSAEPDPLRNVLIGGIESLLEGIGRVWGNERQGDRGRERGKKKEKKGRGRRGTESCLFRKWQKDRECNVLNPMFFFVIVNCGLCWLFRQWRHSMVGKSSPMHTCQI